MGAEMGRQSRAAEGSPSVVENIGVAANLDVPMHEEGGSSAEPQSVSTLLRPTELGRIDIAGGKYTAVLMQADREVSLVLESPDGRSVRQVGVNQYGAGTEVVRDGDNIITIKNLSCTIEVGVRSAGAGGYLRDLVEGFVGVKLPGRVDAAFDYESPVNHSRYADETAYINVIVPGARTAFSCRPHS